MKTRFTDEHKYPHGYTPSGATDIRETFKRARTRNRALAESTRVKVTALPPMKARKP